MDTPQKYQQQRRQPAAADQLGGKSETCKLCVRHIAEPFPDIVAFPSEAHVSTEKKGGEKERKVPFSASGTRLRQRGKREMEPVFYQQSG